MDGLLLAPQDDITKYSVTLQLQNHGTSVRYFRQIIPQFNDICDTLSIYAKNQISCHEVLLKRTSSVETSSNNASGIISWLIHQRRRALVQLHEKCADFGYGGCALLHLKCKR